MRAYYHPSLPFPRLVPLPIFVPLPGRMALSTSFLPRLGREIHTHTHSMYSILQEKLAAMARVQVRRAVFYDFFCLHIVWFVF